ncbi:MAG: ATP-binding cassette domain-containing protein [Chloroflexi bacterium]|nr:ATP-binding cassette domain-containing protein [Chloroflexota bacterium]
MITIRDLSKRYDDNTVLNGINLDVPTHTVTAIIGPSGSGKTTLLRLIDLLEGPTSGEISFDGVGALTSEDARLEMRRRMVIVFQKPVVFSGSVYDNVSYGLKIRGQGRRDMREKVLHALETVDLSGYENRRARTLSWGEAQRVALARAMVIEPELLLLDEPTANLDPVSTARVEQLIARVIGELHTTVIMATHDMAQGQRLADQIAVLIGGEMLQVGNPGEIFNLPNSMQVAHFVGVENVLEGVIASKEQGLVNVSIGSHVIEGISDLEPGAEVSACIRPEEVILSLTQAPTSAGNTFYGTITSMVSTGPLVRVVIDCGFPLVALITTRSAQELELKRETRVCASFKATGVHIVKG